MAEDGPWTSLIKAIAGRKSVGPYTTAGSTGTVAFGGYLVNNEKQSSLQGAQRYVTYSELLANTSIVAAGTRYFLNILGKGTWSVEPATDSEGKELPGAKEAADLVESCMSDMNTSWAKVIRRGSMYRFFGFSVQEWTAKRRDDGKIGMLDVEPRPQVTMVRWDLDDAGNVLGVFQRTLVNPQELYLPRQKIIHIVDDSLNSSPEGLGVFRHLVKHADRLGVLEDLEEIAYETDLRGIPIGRAPLNDLRKAEEQGKMPPATINRLLKPIENFLSGHLRNIKSGLMLDSATYVTTDERQAPSNQKMWDIELLQGQATSQVAVAAAITRINKEMAIVMGCEHLLLGQDGTGSLALSKTKSTDFLMTVAGVQKDLIESYNRDYVAPICDLNGIPKELRPKIKGEDVQFKDVDSMASALKDMATAGAVLAPDDPAINEMRDLLGLSRTPQEIIDRTMNDSALKTGAELDALSAKANAALGKPGDNGAIKPGESGGKPAKGAA